MALPVTNGVSRVEHRYTLRQRREPGDSLAEGESIVASSWTEAERWLPLTTIANFAAGGSQKQSMTTAGLLSLLSIAIALPAAFTAISRRDITE